MCGPQVDIPVFVCMTLVCCKFPQEPHGRNVSAVKKTGDIHEGAEGEGGFDMVSQWGEIRL